MDLFETLYKDSRKIRKIRIEFDGGTPCNIPRLGYGDGYGSYQIQDCQSGTHFPIARINFARPMSANAAEIHTLVRAVEEVIRRFGKDGIELDIHGDSKIALKWARGATESGRRVKPVKAHKVSGEFGMAISELQKATAGFSKVTATWRGRDASVKLFGH